MDTAVLTLTEDFPSTDKPLFGFRLELLPGELLYVEGDYASGGDALLDHLAGARPCAPGSKLLKGRDVSRDGPELLHRQGVVYASGRRRLIGSLTMVEHLRLRLNTWPCRLELTAAIEEAHRRFSLLREIPLGPCGDFSGGQQQVVMLALATVCRPLVLVLDEPYMGLAPQIRGDVTAALADLRAGGTALVVLEQRASELVAEARWRYRLRPEGVVEPFLLEITCGAG